MLYCERCQLEYPEGKKFCRQCGEPLKPKATISPGKAAQYPSCGAPISPGIKFCGKCGTSLVGQKTYPVEEVSLEEEIRQRRKEILRGLGAGIGVVVLLAAVVIGGLYVYRVYFGPEEEVVVVPPKVTSGQVMIAEKLGFNISGIGAKDPGRSSAIVRGQVETYFPKLKEAYDHALKADPSLMGGIVLYMIVTAEGEIMYLKAEPAGITDKTFIETVQNQAQTWKFPSISAGVVAVRYPLLFYPEGMEPGKVIASLPTDLPKAIGGQVMTAKEPELKITGAGAEDPRRSPEAIREQVETHFPKLKEAYDQALETDFSLMGSITLHMTVASDGAITHVRAEPVGTTDKNFVETVHDQAHTWKFPPIPAGMVSVCYPLLFCLEGMEPEKVIALLPAKPPPPPSVAAKIESQLRKEGIYGVKAHQVSESVVRLTGEVRSQRELRKARAIAKEAMKCTAVVAVEYEIDVVKSGRAGR